MLQDSQTLLLLKIKVHLEFGNRFTGHRRLSTAIASLRLQKAAKPGDFLPSKQQIPRFTVRENGAASGKLTCALGQTRLAPPRLSSVPPL